MNRTPLAPRAARVVTSVRDELRERRRARRDYRTLARELATYTTRSDVDDLMATLADQQGEEAERVRRILTQNLHANRRLAS